MMRWRLRRIHALSIAHTLRSSLRTMRDAGKEARATMTSLSKQCKVCGESKPLSYFHRRSASSDGHRTRCKICTGKANKAVLESPHGDTVRANGRAGYYRNPDRRKATSKSWRSRQSIGYRAAESRRRRSKHREQDLSHQAVHRALASGKLIRLEDCEHCGNPSEHAHHEDYNKQLEVVWLCKPCHGLVHRKGVAP